MGQNKLMQVYYMPSNSFVPKHDQPRLPVTLDSLPQSDIQGILGLDEFQFRYLVNLAKSVSQEVGLDSCLIKSWKYLDEPLKANGIDKVFIQLDISKL